MTLPSPVVRRVRTPGWLDLRLVSGVLLVLAAVLTGSWLFARSDHTEPVLALTHDMAAGSRLDAADVQVVRVRLHAGGAGRYLHDRDGVQGRQLNRALGAGELVPATAVIEAPAQTTVSVPLGDGAAPRLRDGDRIRVWLSVNACAPIVILPDATVQQVRDAEGSRLGVRGGQDVVLSLDPALAERVVAALARDHATVRAGVLSGPVAPAPTALPALDECVSGGVR